ncbi:MAG: YihY/virulence factor BrkB family protein [Mangrovicoccus sp.]|nr:YihY/virulence factor BrkB family protein [Mangrovicoccus sp.]
MKSVAKRAGNWPLVKMVGPIWRLLSGIFARAEAANLSLVAAGGAFFAMLSLFPALAALIAVVGLVTDPSLVEHQLALLEEFIPAEAYNIIKDQLTSLVSTNTGTLGWTTALTTGAALWSARRGTDALIRAMNAIHGAPQRGGIWGNIMALILTLAMILVITISALALVAVPMVVQLLTLDIFAELVPPELIAWATGRVLTLSRWVIAGGVVFGGIWVLYRFAPNGPGARVHLFSPGALLAIAIWLPASWGFSHYLAFAGAYSGVYGSIGAIIALLMFLYLTILSVLMGATLNAELTQEAIEDKRKAAALAKETKAARESVL